MYANPVNITMNISILITINFHLIPLILKYRRTPKKRVTTQLYPLNIIFVEYSNAL